MRKSKNQWIEDRREKFRCPHCGEVVGCSDDGVIGMFSAKIRSVHQERCTAAHES